MFLALTANQDFGDKQRNGIFLGQWCIPFDTPAIKEREYKTLPYIFDDRTKLFQAYRYVESVYFRTMPCLAERLNAVHHTDYSERYWEIVIGYWLREYLEVLYERYECIRAALNRVRGAQVKLIHPDDYLILEDGQDFEKRCVTDLYNLQLYSQIIKHLGGFEITHVRISRDAWRLPRGGWRTILMLRTKNFIKWVSLLCSRWNKIYLCSMYFPVYHLISIAHRLKIFPTIDTPQFRIKSAKTCDSKLREQLAVPPNVDEFERLVWLTLQHNIPQIYIENFAPLKRLVQKYYPKRAKLIATANAFAINEGFKLWTAEQTEQYNTPYVIHQHGGNYGCALWNSSEDYETRISDYYLTYGWEDSGRKNIIPFYASRILSPRDGRICGNPEGDILWVLASFPRYAYTMYSVPAGPPFKEYLNDQIRFLCNLRPQTKRLIKCRAYPIEYGWSDIDYIKKRAGDFKLDHSKRTVQGRLSSMRLFVCTYNATAHLESIAANVPTIIYWNAEHWDIRESAREAFDALHNVGILYYSPEDAAKKVESILENTFDWWGQSDIQQARTRFCEQFARTHSSACKVWADWLQEHARPE